MPNNVNPVRDHDAALKILNSDVHNYLGKLFCARIFYRSPILNEVETVAIYSTDNLEVMNWAHRKFDHYKELNIPVSVYLNYNFEDSHGDLFNIKECK